MNTLFFRTLGALVLAGLFLFSANSAIGQIWIDGKQVTRSGFITIFYSISVVANICVFV